MKEQEQVAIVWSSTQKAVLYICQDTKIQSKNSQNRKNPLIFVIAKVSDCSTTQRC